jgi:hypothetical protein
MDYPVFDLFHPLIREWFAEKVIISLSTGMALIAQVPTQEILLQII